MFYAIFKLDCHAQLENPLHGLDFHVSSEMYAFECVCRCVYVACLRIKIWCSQALISTWLMSNVCNDLAHVACINTPTHTRMYMCIYM